MGRELDAAEEEVISVDDALNALVPHLFRYRYLHVLVTLIKTNKYLFIFYSYIFLFFSFLFFSFLFLFVLFCYLDVPHSKRSIE